MITDQGREFVNEFSDELYCVTNTDTELLVSTILW